MKIHEVGRSGALNAYRRHNEAAIDNNVRSRKMAKDRVQISAEAKELLEAQAVNDPDRAERISELKQAVHDGTYHVPAAQIADKLLRYYLSDPN